MKKPKTNIFKLRMIKPLYKKFGSVPPVARRLKLDTSTVYYWLGKIKKKQPKMKLDSFKILPEDYVKQLNKVDADTENPKQIGKKLREEYKGDFNIYPEKYEKK